jgi:hypothetical protein
VFNTRSASLERPPTFVPATAFLHGVTFDPSLPEALLVRSTLTEDGSGSWLPVVHRVSGPRTFIEEAAHGLPEGAARPEGIAARLRRRGVELSWREPDVVRDPGALLAIARARGRSSVDILRADPALVGELQIGSWFDAPWLRRLVQRIPAPAVLLRRGLLRHMFERAFWRGVRSRAMDLEWRRLTRSSYVVLLYHRIAEPDTGEDERLLVPPAALESQLKALYTLKFRALSPEELLGFHEGGQLALGKRSYVVTADDGFVDALEGLRRQPRARPQLFVPTLLVGGRASWSSARVAGWTELRAATADGVSIGSHTRTHRSLLDLPADELADELGGSLGDLREQLEDFLPIIAYPHGRSDSAAQAAAASAGFRAAYTTAPGRNSAGTDPYRLRRISIKAWDGRLSFLWKVLTGQPLPRRWEERRLRVYRRRENQRERRVRSS